MGYFVAGTVAGLMVGAIYALVALSFTLMYRSSGAISFAQGDIVMVGALIGYLLVSERGLPLLLGWLVAILCGGALGLLTQLLLTRLPPPLLLNGLIVTFALSVIVEAAVGLWQGGTIFTMATFPGVPAAINLNLGHSFVPGQLVWVLGTYGVVVAATLFLLYKTPYGRALRAVGSDSEVAESLGISAAKVIAIAFVWSGVVAAIAGFVTAPLIYVGFSGGQTFTFYGVTAAIVGGIRRVEGALLGGLVLGLAENLAAVYGAPQFAEVITFVLLIGLLLVRPSGILRDPTESR